MIGKIVRRGLIAITILALIGAGSVVGVYYSFAPQLPSVEVLRDIRFQVPLQVYTEDGTLIAEYGEKKRIPVSFDEIPDLMTKAVLAAEDDRFFEHPGVDYQGILRAAYHLITTGGEKAQGGSTITMQVARNFFLSTEKTYTRKIKEILLSLKIEKELTKHQIFELYANKIYLGNRAYGFASAAQVYYGRPLSELDVAQYAMIAGLPKAPSRYNPIANPSRALIRRDYVLGRMHKLGFISDADYTLTKAAPVTASLHSATVGLEAPYMGEMVRAYMYERHGEEAYTHGFKVYITLESDKQLAANAALRNALRDYDQRHGYRGPYARENAPDDAALDTLAALVKPHPRVGGLTPVLILGTEGQQASALMDDGTQITLPWEGLSWASPYLSVNRKGPAPQTAEDILARGDIVYVTLTADNAWQLTQIPEVAGAIVALDPHTGAIRALTGGFDFFYSKFNRAVQARRQPGSSFKPFIYSAALEAGYTPASIINDAPVVFDDPSLEASWRPENYSGRFYGPTRLREALVHSRNLVSIRLLQAIGIDFSIAHLDRFGFNAKQLPRNLSLSLGSSAVTPWDLASAYAVLANGGYRIEPYYIARIEDNTGTVIEYADPLIVCDECDETTPPDHDAAPLSEPPVSPLPDDDAAESAPAPPPPRHAQQMIPEQNIYLITSMMRDVIRRGTGRRALQLGRNDLAGKTGTTNDQRDAWFAGFNADLVTVTWTGFDSGAPLGDRETGGRAALPMWMEFMAAALKDMPETQLEQPPGLVTVRIDPVSGLLAGADVSDAIFETFRQEDAPTTYDAAPQVPVYDQQQPGTEQPATQLLF